LSGKLGGRCGSVKMGVVEGGEGRVGLLMLLVLLGDVNKKTALTDVL